MKDVVKIKLIDRPDEKYIDCKDIELTFSDKTMEYFAEGKVQYTDEEKGKTTEYFFIIKTFMKDKLSALHLRYLCDTDKFKVEIFFYGVPDRMDIIMFFDEYEKAKEVCTKILTW